MKTITKISMQQNGERYNLFLDEAFFCGVSEDTLIKLSLKKGMQIDEERLQELTEEEERNRCFSYAIYLLGRHNYFEKNLRDKLKQKEYNEEQINFAIEKLRSYNYIDDNRLAESFVRDKKRFAKKGPRYIAQALRAKGVDGEAITEVLKENYSEEERLENCREIALKKLDYYKKKTSDTYTLKGKMYAFLAQRGFEGEIIKKTLGQIIE